MFDAHASDSAGGGVPASGGLCAGTANPDFARVCAGTAVDTCAATVCELGHFAGCGVPGSIGLGGIGAARSNIGGATSARPATSYHG